MCQNVMNQAFININLINKSCTFWSMYGNLHVGDEGAKKTEAGVILCNLCNQLMEHVVHLSDRHADISAVSAAIEMGLT